MGKHKIPSSKRPKVGEKNGADNLPSFDERALSVLTEKIENEFGKNKAPGNSAEQISRNHKQDDKRKKAHPVDPKPKHANTAEQIRGRKRDAKGNIKAGDSRTQPTHSQQSREKNDDRTRLLQEILALGGTEEDLDLVADAASDDEGLEAQAIPDKLLKKDLANFVASLGIEGQVDAEASDSEDGKEVEDEWEETSDLEAVAESDNDVEEYGTVQPVAAATTNGETSAKEENRLVGPPLSQLLVQLTSNRYLKLEPTGMLHLFQTSPNQNPRISHNSVIP